ncbi:MAG: hypothetical protein HY769_00110 [Candidatus Stahlbacteria bacterium]|nr:hypothetical protein [Candidatus Stahlbacteria bacterium]
MPQKINSCSLRGGNIRKRWYFIILFALTLVSVSYATKTKKIEEWAKKYENGVYLKYKPIEGSELWYKTTLSINSTVDMKGMGQSSITSMGIRIKKGVERIAGDTLVLKITYDKAEGTIKTGAQLMAIPKLDKLKGQEISLTIVHGKVVNKKIIANIDDEMKQYVEGIVQEVEQELKIFSGEKMLKIGDKWDVEYEEIEGKKVKTQYRLEDFREKEGFECAKIMYDSQIELNENQTQQGMQVKFIGKGKEKGEIYFAINEGYKIYEKSTASVEGKSEVVTIGSVDVYTDVNSETKLVTKEK